MMTKRLLSLILVLSLAISLLSPCVSANENADSDELFAAGETADALQLSQGDEEISIPEEGEDTTDELSQPESQPEEAPTEEAPQQEGQEEQPEAAATLTVTMSETGTLEQLVENTPHYEQELATDLTVITEPGVFMNYNDFTFIRSELMYLKRLDISQADCLNDYDPDNPVEHEIPPSAMAYHTGLETIVLSEKCTSIAKGAFSGCTGLRGDLVIPDSVTHLGTIAFGFWGPLYPSFDSLTLSSNMETMEAGAFLRCKIVGKVVIPASVKYMGGDWTYGGVFQAGQFDEIEFEENGNLEYIGSYCFSGVSTMHGSLNLPDTVKTICGYAFSGCSSLDGQLHIPASIETIGGGAFYGCAGLTGELSFPSTTRTIDSSAFNGCKGLTGLSFEEGVVTIGGSAFNGCSGLTGQLTLPDSLVTIGASAFGGCTGLSGTLTLGSGLKTIGSNAFANLKGLSGTLILPEEMTSIGSSAFAGCSGLTGLELPQRINNIDGSAFASCSAIQLENPRLPQGMAKVSDSLFTGCTGISGTVDIPEGVTYIGSSAFTNTALTGDLALPNSLVTIGLIVIRN